MQEISRLGSPPLPRRRSAMTFAASAAFLRQNWRRVLLGILAIYVFFGNSGFRGLVGHWYQLRKMRGDIANLERDEASLEAKLKSVRAGDTAVEAAARRELGYIGKDEIEYRFPAPRTAQ